MTKLNWPKSLDVPFSVAVNSMSLLRMRLYFHKKNWLIDFFACPVQIASNIQANLRHRREPIQSHT
jgi:hypothetical protein